MIMIISQPKSGTYLCANLLVEMGYNFRGLHIGKNEYQLYDLKNLEDCRKYPKKYTHKAKLATILSHIQPNEVAVTHLPYRGKIPFRLKKFKKIFLYRDLNERVKSWYNWTSSTGRDTNLPENMKVENSNIMYNWQLEHNTFSLKFDDLKYSNIEEIDQLQYFLFGSIKFKSKKIIKRALNRPSLTKVEKT